MLKGLVALLLLLNLALGAVLAGWLPAPGLDEAEREPARLQRQVQPEVLTLTPPGPVTTPPSAPPGATPGLQAPAPPASAAMPMASASAGGSVGGLPPGGLAGADTAAAPSVNASVLPAAQATALPTVMAAPGAGPTSASTPAPAPAPAAVATSQPAAVAGVCLQTSPLTAVQAARLEAALREANWAQEGWRRTALPATTRYLLLMGPYASDELMARKQRELARRKVAWTELSPSPELPAGLTPGLSLGRHDSEAAAEAALRRLNDRGVRSARVISLPPVAGQALLRLDPVSPAQQAKLARLPLPANASWQSCG